MFNINGYEFLILGIIAVLVIGPKRLPEYAQKFRNFVKEARRMASGARDQLKEESGVDLSTIDWQKLDPRQYDPRRIIREALLDDEPGQLAVGAATPTPPMPEVPPMMPVRETVRLSQGQKAPWDTEAT
ncbi:Sec-independent protein translocase TatB [Psychromicrobium sp. YIM B11713]|uniref:Sec-independent protein translocase TatB n=1 Tax=Psychromicrobium sp. YIM B11713 TaxID=3145233 RepID=UPI00374EB074